MKKNLVLTLMALIVAVVGLRPVYGQDFGLVARQGNLGALGSRGAVAAQPGLGGLLGGTLDTLSGVQLNGLGTSTTVDVAVGDFNGDGTMDIAAVSRDAGGQITITSGLGDGTFGLPLNIPTTSTPRAIAASDMDLDGITDIAVVGDGTLDVVNGISIALGANQVDMTFPLAAAGSSVAFGRLDGDAVADIVVTSRGGNLLSLFATAAMGGMLAPAGNLNTTGLISTGTAGVIVDAPRAVTTQQSNLALPAVDADIDIFVATTLGVEIFENITIANGPLQFGSGITPSLLSAATIPAGTTPVGVVASDVNGDNRADIIALNRGSGTVSVSLAGAVVGYGSPQQSVAGSNPTSLSVLNANNDGRVDIVVVSEGTQNAGNTASSAVVLTGNGLGAFSTARSIGFPGLTSVAVGRLATGSQADDLVLSAVPGFTPGGVLYLQSANPATVSFTQVPAKLYTAVSLAADFDGMGGLNDIVVIEQNLGLAAILFNIGQNGPASISLLNVAELFTNGNLRPTSATAFRDAMTGMTNLAVTDVLTPTNNNGSGQIVVGKNLGGGNFGDIFQFRQFVATPGATNIVNGDFNNDNRDDLVYVDTASNFALVALNDGSDAFLNPSFRETGGFGPVSAAVADVNDDDMLDVVVVNQSPGIQGNQSIVSVLNGNGAGQLIATGALLQVPNFALSIVGGLADVEANGVRRVVDFNSDGFPDFAVVSTRGGSSSIGVFVPTVSLIINRPDAPGNFVVQPPVPLIDDTAGPNGFLSLDSLFNGPQLVSGFGGVGVGGANYTLAVADFNADASPDLVVSGTNLLGGQNFRSTIYLLGNGTAGTLRIARPQRTGAYTTVGSIALDPATQSGDIFVASATGSFVNIANNVPDAIHMSLNGNLFIDQNISSILNHAPILTIRRQDLNAPMGMGRKVVVTAGQTVTVPVTGFDVDGDRLRFSLAPTPTGEQPPSFVAVQDNGNNTATIRITPGDVNRGPSNLVARIAVQATDAGSPGAGGRLPLIGREYFTLIVRPNTPPTIGAIANQTVEAGRTSTVNLVVNDREGGAVTNTVACDRGNFVSVNGTTLSIAPQAGDVGTSTCTVTATDQAGLASSTSFAITVLGQNIAPSLATITDQTVRSGQTVTVPVMANDPNGNNGLRLALVSAPAFVSLADNGNGTGTIRISPAVQDTQGGRVTIQVTDTAGLTGMTSFNVTVQRSVNIATAGFNLGAKQLSISGSGFGTAGARVTVNGQDVSSRISSQSDTSIVLSGNRRRLNVRAGANQVVVTSGGITSNTFTFNN
jgi:FG-GAP-like repeat